MATFTITTPVNIDTLAAKTGNDTYNINGGYLTIDQDSRFGTNGNTSAILGNITLSATLGGTIEINSTAVRLIPFNTGSGVVPASNTIISQGGASGKLIGVYADLVTAPLAAASAMPVTGFIKIKQTVGTFAAGALAGITANSTGADEPGWIEIVGANSGLLTVNRLNSFKAVGDYYYFRGATTSGISSTTYQIPSNGALVWMAGVWVETGTNTNVYEFYPCAGSNYAHIDSFATDAVRGKVCWISTSGQVSFQNDGTYNSGGYLPPAGRRIRIPNIFMSCAVAGTPTINDIPNATMTNRYEFSTSGGGVIDMNNCMTNWYCNFTQSYSITLNNVGILSLILANEVATPMIWTQVGVGQEAAVAYNGLAIVSCPDGGVFTDCTWSVATVAASGRYVCVLSDISGFTFNNNKFMALATRLNTSTGTGSLTRADDCVFNNCILGGGRMVLATCANVEFNNTSYYDHPAWDSNFTSSAITTDSVAWTRSGGTATATLANHGLKVGDTFSVTLSSDATAISNANKTVGTVISSSAFTFTATNAGATSGTLSYTRTSSTFPTYAFELSSSCSDVRVDSLNFSGLEKSQPYSGLISIAASGCKNIDIRNIGTYSSPLELGAARVDDVPWTRATTTITVTKTNHGLRPNDVIYVVVTSSPSTITLASKTIIATPTANTFTFAGTNASATSGNLSYYQTITGSLVVVAAGANAKNVRLQRVYTEHNRTAIISGDNSSTEFLLENVASDPQLGLSLPILNCLQKGIVGTPLNTTTQTAVYGTMWGDFTMSNQPTTDTTVTWNRAATIATVTSNNHKLRTGMVINVYDTTSSAAVTNGNKTITVLDSNTFNFTCLNAGATSGTLSFQTVNGRISITMNEASAYTTDQYTIDSGTPAFTAGGTLYMPTIGQQITFVMPYYVIGHNSFPIVEPIMTGGTISNYDITYNIDKNDGDGYSAIRNMYYQRAGGSGTSGQFTFTVTDATGVDVGDYVFGTGIAPNAKVTNKVSNTLTVDLANVATVSGVIRFTHLPSESVSAQNGFKLKVTLKTIATNATAISSLSFNTFVADASRAYQYPLENIDAVLSVQGLKSNSEIRIYRASDDTLLSGIENSGTSFEYDYVWTGTDFDVYVVVHALGYVPIRYEAQTLGRNGLVIPVQQQIDRVYANL